MAHCSSCEYVRFTVSSYVDNDGNATVVFCCCFCRLCGPKFIFIKSHKMLVISDHNHSASLSILSLFSFLALSLVFVTLHFFSRSTFLCLLLSLNISRCWCRRRHLHVLLLKFGTSSVHIINVYDMAELKLIKSAHKKPFTKLMSINNVKSRETH